MVLAPLLRGQMKAFAGFACIFIYIIYTYTYINPSISIKTSETNLESFRASFSQLRWLHSLWLNTCKSWFVSGCCWLLLACRSRCVWQIVRLLRSPASPWENQQLGEAGATACYSHKKVLLHASWREEGGLWTWHWISWISWISAMTWRWKG